MATAWIGLTISMADNTQQQRWVLLFARPVEVKAGPLIHPRDVAQTASYLAATMLPLALILNFGAPLMREGIRRVIRTPR